MAKSSSAQLPSVPSADKAAALALTPVSRETESAAGSLCRASIGVAGQDQSCGAVYASDFVDSACGRSPFSSSLSRPKARTWVDLGSGGGFPASCWLARWLSMTALRFISLSEMQRKPHSCARLCESPTQPVRFIWLISGIMWIVPRRRWIASPPVHSLLYICSWTTLNP